MTSKMANPGWNLALPKIADMRAEHREGLLGGVMVIRDEALDDVKRLVSLTAVPYYAWAGRERGRMAVWLAEELTPAADVPTPGNAGM